MHGFKSYNFGIIHIYYIILYYICQVNIYHFYLLFGIFGALFWQISRKSSGFRQRVKICGVYQKNTRLGGDDSRRDSNRLRRPLASHSRPVSLDTLAPPCSLLWLLRFAKTILYRFCSLALAGNRQGSNLDFGDKKRTDPIGSVLFWRRRRDLKYPLENIVASGANAQRAPDTPYFLPCRTPSPSHRERSCSKPAPFCFAKRRSAKISASRQKKETTRLGGFFFWRRRRDLNSRAG